MKRIWKKICAYACLLSLPLISACGGDVGGGHSTSMDSSFVDSSSGSGIGGVAVDFKELIENPQNMSIEGSLSLTLPSSELQVELAFTGKIAENGGYAHITASMTKNGLPITSMEAEGYYVDGVIYNPTLKEKEEISWEDWMSRTVGLSSSTQLPLHLLSKQVQEEVYTVLQNGNLKLSVQGDLASYAIRHMLSSMDFYQISNIYIPTFDCIVHITSEGKFQYLEMKGGTGAYYADPGNISVEMSLSKVGTTEVSAPDDGVAYQNITGMEFIKK